MGHADLMTSGQRTIDRAFVEEWSERYRCGAVNSRWRPGPRFRDAMTGRPEFAALERITNYWDLEEHILGTVGTSVRSQGAYTVGEFLTVTYWKSRRQLANYVANEKTSGTVAMVTQAAFAPQPPHEGRWGRLATLTGVRTPVASALLTVWRPDEHTIIDVWALAALSSLGEEADGVPFRDHGQPWWERHYEAYVLACLGIAERVRPLSLRDVDRALWKWGQMNA
jgi:hypothetical protein